jgi:ribonuclease P protein component
MLPHTHRLPSPEIPRVMKEGRRIAGKEAILIYLKSPGKQSAARFGFIVSAKVDKRATGRNRTRRLLSESVRLLLNSIHTGYDCVFIAKMNFSVKRQNEVNQIIERVLKSAGVLKSKYQGISSK